MTSNAIFFAWNRSIPGREQTSATHFDEFVKYLAELQQKGAIQSFEPVLLDWHGGDLNGFFLIKGEPAKLDGLVGSESWRNHMTRCAMHLTGTGAVRAFAGDTIPKLMQIWRSHIPK